MTSQKLVAVVVTYNRLDKLKVTLARLLESPEHELSRVVVVDNASTDHKKCCCFVATKYAMLQNE